MAEKVSDLNYKKEKITNKSIFSKDNVNTGHQPELNYLKAFMIILMTTQHIHENYSRDSSSIIIDYLNSVTGAPGFMLLMGIGMKYSRHQDPNNYIERGILLLTKGLYVNLLKNALPNLIAWWATGNKKFISRALLVIQTDILMFAGISFLLLAIMKQKKLSDNIILIISFIMNIIALFLFKIMKSPNNFLFSQFLGYFVLTDADTYFPLFSYFVFVGMGNWLGGFYQKISNKDKFYNIILIICLPIITIYYYLRYSYTFPMFINWDSYEHYSLNPGPDAIFICMINLVALAIFFKINLILKGETPSLITHLGKNQNKYYMLSYIITMQSNILLRATKGEEFPSKIKYPVLLCIIVLFLCKITIDMNDKYLHFTITNLERSKRNFILTLIWIMTIISTIYIYPKVETYATFWNDYLYEEDY